MKSTAIPGIAALVVSVVAAAAAYGNDGRQAAVDAANAQGVTAADFDYDMNRSGTGIRITKYKGLATVIDIPSVIEGFPVREIDWEHNGITGNKELERIRIPSSFSLKSVVFPRDFSFPLNSYAILNLNGCTSLTSFEIPKEVRLFSLKGCTGLQSVILPAGITGIYPEAFAGCTSLTSIALPAGLTLIGAGVFAGSGLESITLPGSLTGIGAGAFANCGALTGVTIPRNVRMVGAFWNAHYSTAQELWLYTFDSFDGVFEGCENLKSVTVQGALRGLGPETFKGCTALETVTFNGPITYVGKGAFEGCVSLAELAFNGDVRYMGFFISRSESGFSVWHDWLIEFEENGREADREAVFTGCTGLTTVTVGPAVTKIDNVDSIPKDKLTLASQAALAKVR